MKAKGFWLIVLAVSLWGFLLCGVSFGADITIKNVPDGISEQQIKEWCAVLVERHETAKVNQIPEVATATATAKTNIDLYRKANALQPKFEAIAKPAE